MPTATAITPTGTFYADSLDPMLAALRQGLIDATGAILDEFGADQVVVVPPEETDAGISAKIATAMARNKGLCLLLVPGGGKNPDSSAPGPRMALAVEAQLYVSSRIRGAHARSVLELLGALMKFFHHAQLRISGFPWYEEIRVLGFDPLPDPDFTAYVLNLEREFQL